jgi:Flp pilus assembly protein CpaB
VSAQTDLADRYGAPGPWRSRLVLAASVALAAAFLGWLGWTIWSQSTPQVDSQMIGYRVQDEHEAIATVDIDLADDDVEANCRLRAYAEDHTVVGDLSFTPERSGHTEQSVRTERRATSVELLGCTAPGQNRPR